MTELEGKVEKLRHSDKETEKDRRAKGKQREMGAVMLLDRQKRRRNIQKMETNCSHSEQIGRFGPLWMPIHACRHARTHARMSFILNYLLHVYMFLVYLQIITNSFFFPSKVHRNTYIVWCKGLFVVTAPSLCLSSSLRGGVAS